MITLVADLPIDTLGGQLQPATRAATAAPALVCLGAGEIVGALLHFMGEYVPWTISPNNNGIAHYTSSALHRTI